MTAGKRLPFVARLIVALFSISISVLWLAQAASAQSIAISDTADTNLTIGPGDTIEIGIVASISDAVAAPSTATVTLVNPVVQLPVSCANGSSQTITINLSSQSWDVPQDVTTWSSPNSVYQGQATAPSTLCGGQTGMTGVATMTGTFGFVCQKSQACCHQVCFQFCHRHQHRGSWFGNTLS
ncbi:MAG TPA: hypothetical protein VEK33_10950, partial [Terriglobales bacterium]|nr:hypothetical protein [Terriglobales bacterium]